MSNQQLKYDVEIHTDSPISFIYIGVNIKTKNLIEFYMKLVKAILNCNYYIQYFVYVYK
jgi:hypothetical protein